MANTLNLSPVETAIGPLVERFNPEDLDLAGARRARVELEVRETGSVEVEIDPHGAQIAAGKPRGNADAMISATPAAWSKLSADSGQGLRAFGGGELSVRRNLNIGIGFLAATSGDRHPSRVRFVHRRVDGGHLSTIEAGQGEAILLVHGLGASKVSMLPLMRGLARSHRVIAFDLPGFGDSVKPLRGPYDAEHFARSAAALMESMDIPVASIIGNSMGGRVALQLALQEPDRTKRLVLLAPSLAWKRNRAWAPLLRFVRPELGLLQPNPFGVTDGLIRRVLPESSEEWVAAGIDEFLRSYRTARGRAAFYAAARNIYLDTADGANGFWTRLGTLKAPALFIWGTRDRLIPLGFARHVERELPSAEHLELDCGHVPQLERPRQTEQAIAKFLRQ